MAENAIDSFVALYRVHNRIDVAKALQTNIIVNATFSHSIVLFVVLIFSIIKVPNQISQLLIVGCRWYQRASLSLSSRNSFGDAGTTDIFSQSRR